MTKEEIMQAIENIFGIEMLAFFPKANIVPKSLEEVLEHIVLAQIASDGGKDKDRFIGITKGADETYKWGYYTKDLHIFEAILGIEKLHLSDVKWFVSSNWEHDTWYDEDQMASIIYFEWDGRQISFHSFSPIWEKVVQLFGWNHCDWDEKSSPETTMEMMYFLSRKNYGAWATHDAKELIIAMMSYVDETGDVDLNEWQANKQEAIRKLRRTKENARRKILRKKQKFFLKIIKSHKQKSDEWWKEIRHSFA